VFIDSKVRLLAGDCSQLAHTFKMLFVGENGVFQTKIGCFSPTDNPVRQMVFAISNPAKLLVFIGKNVPLPPFLTFKMIRH